MSTASIPAVEYPVDAILTERGWTVKVLATGARLDITLNEEALTADKPSFEVGLVMSDWQAPTQAKPRRCVIVMLDDDAYAMYGAKGVSGETVAMDRAGLDRTKKELCEDNEQLRQAIDVVILGQTPGEQYIVPGLLKMSAQKGSTPGLLGGPRPGGITTITAYLFAVDTAFGKIGISIATASGAVTVDWSAFKGLSATGGDSQPSGKDELSAGVEVVPDRANKLRDALDLVARSAAGKYNYALHTPSDEALADERHYDFYAKYFSFPNYVTDDTFIDIAYGYYQALSALDFADYANALKQQAKIFSTKLLIPVGPAMAELSGFHLMGSSGYEGDGSFDMLCCNIHLSSGAYANKANTQECVSGKLDAKLVFKFYVGEMTEDPVTPRVSLVVGKGDVCELRHLSSTVQEME